VSPDDTDGAAPMIHLTLDGAVARLTLDRPPLNVLTIAMLREMARTVAEVAAADEVSVLVIEGKGKAFCAGVDVADHTEDRVPEMLEVFHGALSRIEELEVPVVAAVHGACLGGGMELALACDLVLASEDARLGQPEVRLGVLPPYAAVVLPGRIGRGTAFDLVLTGRTLHAAEARDAGLVQHVFPRDVFADEVAEYVGRLASLSAPVLKLAKRALATGLSLPPEEALRVVEDLYRNELMGLEDAREGLSAFMERRSPVWKGR